MSVGRKLSRLLRVKVGVRISTYSTLLLELIGCLGPLEMRALGQSVGMLKQQLKDLEVDQYLLIDGAEIVAGIFTKTGFKTKGLQEIV